VTKRELNFNMAKPKNSTTPTPSVTGRELQRVLRTATLGIRKLETSMTLLNSSAKTSGPDKPIFPYGFPRIRGPLTDKEFLAAWATTFSATDPNWTVVTSYGPVISRGITRTTYILRVASCSGWWNRCKRLMGFPFRAHSQYSYLTYTYSFKTRGGFSE